MASSQTAGGRRTRPIGRAGRCLLALLLVGPILLAPASLAHHEAGSGSAPQANFTVSPLEPRTGETVVFTDTSEDPDGDLEGWRFAFGDGVATGSDGPYHHTEQQHRYADDGTYRVRLTVTDEAGHNDTFEHVLTVRNRPPTASMSVDPANVSVGETVRFSDLSSDPDGEVAQRTWRLGDGNTSHRASVEHRYAQPGSYTVELTIVDDDGAQARTERVVNVTTTSDTAGSTGRLQTLVDAAPPGSILDVPGDRYDESVRIGKPLTIVADAPVVVDGGSRPAVRIEGADVEMRNLTLRSEGTAVDVVDARRIVLWNLTLDAPSAAIQARDSGWITVVQPPDREHPSVDASNASVLHAHPIRLRVGDGEVSDPEGYHVRVTDGGQVVFDGRTAEDGRLPILTVAHRWQRGATGGSNETFVSVADGPASRLDPHAGSVVLEAPQAGASDRLATPAAVATAVAVVSVASFAAAWTTHEGFRWWFWTLIAPLYSRMRRSELLDHEKREAIHEHLQEEPGDHLRGIKRALGLSHGTLLHHLHMLEDRGLILSRKDGMYRRFYLAGQAPDEAGLPGLDERVAQLIRDQPGITNAEIAEELSVTPSNSHYHVRQLLEAGRIRREDDGRRVHLYPTEGMGDR